MNLGGLLDYYTRIFVRRIILVPCSKACIVKRYQRIFIVIICYSPFQNLTIVSSRKAIN